jgi:hypothetical protein
MPREFSELVAEVTERNKRNREAQWNQVAPYLGAMVQKAQYEVAKQKSYKETAEGLSAYAQQEGIGFKPVMIGDNYADVNVQQMAFNKSVEDTKPDLAWKAYSSIYGIKTPDGFGKMTPEQKTVSLAKARDEFVISESINNTIAAYPEIEAQLKADPKFATANPQQKQAIFNRIVSIEEAKQKLAMDMEKKRQEFNMEIQKYWQTTGSTAAARLQFDREKKAENTSQPMANAVNTIKELETNGKMFANHKVVIKKNKDGKFAAQVIVYNKKGDKAYYQKTDKGYWTTDKKGKWTKIDESDLKIKDVVTSLNKGYEDYQKASLAATGKVVNVVQEQEQQKTYSEFDDIFK